MSPNDHAARLREMADEKRDFLMNHDPRLSPQKILQHSDDAKTLMAGAKAIERFDPAMLTLEERTQELLRSIERLEALERERSKLYDAMREVCRIIGGQTIDGVSVDFLTQVPADVEAAIAAVARTKQ